MNNEKAISENVYNVIKETDNCCLVDIVTYIRNTNSNNTYPAIQRLLKQGFIVEKGKHKSKFNNRMSMHYAIAKELINSAEYKDIPGYDGLMININGDVISKARTVYSGKLMYKREKKLKPYTDKSGFVMISYSLNNVNKALYVYKLMSKAYHIQGSGRFIDYVDGDCLNVALNNLFYTDIPKVLFHHGVVKTHHGYMAKVQINKKKYVSKYHETVDLAVDAWYNLITTNA